MDMEGIEGADVITGGFPCQDISYAGKGAELAGKRSGLWWQLRRTIRMVRPRFALLENVAALLNRGMGTVLGSLASIGYDAEWHCIPASRCGKGHDRDRSWIVAHTPSERRTGILYNQLKEQLEPQEEAQTIALDTSRNYDARTRGEIFGEPPIFRGNDGLPNRVHRLRACGNSIYPKIPEIIGRAIIEADND